MLSYGSIAVLALSLFSVGSASPADLSKRATMPTISASNYNWDLNDWRLTTPSSSSTIKPGSNPNLLTYSDINFWKYNGDLVFKTRAGESGNNKYPSTILRERLNGVDAAWQSNDGKYHELYAVIGILTDTTQRKRAVVAELRDTTLDDDIFVVYYMDGAIYLEHEGGFMATLDSSYNLGQYFHLHITVANELVKIFYDGAEKFTLNWPGANEGLHFKAGLTPQTNVDDYGESSSAHIRSKIRHLETKHLNNIPSGYGSANWPAAPSHGYPAASYDLSDWKLQTAFSYPTEVQGAALDTYYHTQFRMLSNNRLRFRTYVDGYTTVNSNYPRTELREMHNGSDADWTVGGSDVHQLEVKLSIDKVTNVRKKVVVGQIHDDTDDVIMIYYDGLLNGGTIYVSRGLGPGNGSENAGNLVTNYSLGTQFTYKIRATGGRIKTYYNGSLKSNFLSSSQGCYFKAGLYLQSNDNSTLGEASNDYAQVTFRTMSLIHT